MKAILCTRYGPPEVLQLAEVKKPAPRKNELCIKIFATAVTASDCIVRGFKLRAWHPMGFIMGLALGFNKPRQPILGMVLAGEVESVGSGVKRFKAGDQVFAFTTMKFRFGAYAEYICMGEDELVSIKPANLTYEEAAAIPYGGLISLHYVRKGKIHSGQKVLIYGASGAIGTSAVQLARYFGAQVTGVCSTANLELVKSLGADKVIDYTREDFTKSGATYDFIFEAVGRKKAGRLPCENALAPNGKYISVDDGSPGSRTEDLVLLKELAEAGKLIPVIDRRYPLEQMAEAHRYADQGHKKGNVVITVANQVDSPGMAGHWNKS